MNTITDTIQLLKARMSDRTKTSLIATVVIAIMTHLFIYTNVFFMHDAMMPYALLGPGSAERYMVSSLARLFNQGRTMPVVIACFSILFLFLTVLFIAKCFDLKKRWSIWLIAAAVITFPTVTISYAYFSSAHLFQFAMAMSTAAAWLLNKCPRKWLGTAAAVLLMIVSNGTYQAYVSWVATLSVLCLIIRILCGNDSLKNILLDAVRIVAAIVAGIGIYYLISHAILNSRNNGWEDYLGQASAWSSILSAEYWLQRLAAIYKQVLGWLYQRHYISYITTTVTLCNWALTLMSGAWAVFLIVKRRIPFLKVLCLVAMVLVLPLSMNVALLMVSMEQAHELMMFSFIAPMILAIVLASSAEDAKPNEERPARSVKRVLRNAYAWLVLAVVLAASVQYWQFANGFYLMQKLGYDESYAKANRIVAAVQSMPGYNTDTAVYICGDTISERHVGFDFASFGIGRNYWGAYPSAFQLGIFINTIMNVDMNVVCDVPCDDPRVQEMPIYPNNGSIRWIDEKIIVKMSD